MKNKELQDALAKLDPHLPVMLWNEKLMWQEVQSAKNDAVLTSLKDRHNSKVIVLR